jgi:hypothetical protein
LEIQEWSLEILDANLPEYLRRMGVDDVPEYVEQARINRADALLGTESTEGLFGAGTRRVGQAAVEVGGIDGPWSRLAERARGSQ